MSKTATNKLIQRMKRTKVNGKGFDAVMSDTIRISLAGEISLNEVRKVHKTAREQLRKFKKGSAR